MSIFNVFSLLGGLALFLYGMSVMGESLEKLAGGKLEAILQKLTSNPIKAVILGAGVTAVIQSSSATTVMVVGLVNSGIMKLEQVVGVIMGANVGTTITSWILSLAGIESSNILLNLLKPSSFSPVLAFIGIFMVMMGKKEKSKTVGLTMVGFAILMFGMDSMSHSLSPLSKDPNFQALFVRFTNPILGMLVGAVLTAIIQSSSASVGILQALSLTGTVSYGAAIPIIMGQNIGTCITAIISSIGASKNARRTSLIHLYFNLLGTIIFMVAFYGLHMALSFTFMDKMIAPYQIAIVHSIFNISAVLVLYPLKNVLVKLAYLSIPDQPDDKEVTVSELRKPLQTLEPRFLDRPGLAMEQVRTAIFAMGDLVQESVAVAVNMLLNGYQQEGADQIDLLESESDRYEDVIGTYLVQLSRRDLTEKEGKLLTLYLKTIGDFERISDHSRNLKASARSLSEKETTFTEYGQAELKIYTDLLLETIAKTLEVFKSQDPEAAYNIEPLEQTVDILSDELKERYIERLKAGISNPQLGFIWADIVTNVERISDHCSNVAVNIIESSKSGFEIHSRLEKIKQGKKDNYDIMVEGYLHKYSLPNEGF